MHSQRITTYHSCSDGQIQGALNESQIRTPGLAEETFFFSAALFSTGNVLATVEAVDFFRVSEKTVHSAHENPFRPAL